jgi:uncharacterized protein (DUF3084 family)
MGYDLGIFLLFNKQLIAAVYEGEDVKNSVRIF